MKGRAVDVYMYLMYSRRIVGAQCGIFVLIFNCGLEQVGDVRYTASEVREQENNSVSIQYIKYLCHTLESVQTVFYRLCRLGSCPLAVSTKKWLTPDRKGKSKRGRVNKHGEPYTLAFLCNRFTVS